MGHPWFVIDVLFRHKWTKKRAPRVHSSPKKREAKVASILLKRKDFL